MTSRQSLLRWSSFGLIGIALLLVAGCIRDPQAIVDLRDARSAMDKAMAESMSEKFPEKMADLEKRYLEARGVYYACDDARASEMARSIIADLQMQPEPAPPANNPPRASFIAPERINAGDLARLDASESSDPDGDSLTYNWQFGDGSGNIFTFPIATHRYVDAGRYTVVLTVDDGRGGTDSTSRTVDVIRQVIMSDIDMVFFDFDRSELKPAAREVLDRVVAELQRRPELRLEIVGHTDSTGSEEYNMGLSRRRAQSAATYVTDSGIAASRLIVAWRGESEPLVPNTTRENRAQNRRVVMTLAP